MKDDPKHSKCFQLSNAGLSKDVLKIILECDKINDASILDMTPNLSYCEQKLQQQKQEQVEEDSIPLKEDLELVKYFEMMKLGITVTSIK